MHEREKHRRRDNPEPTRRDCRLYYVCDFLFVLIKAAICGSSPLTSSSSFLDPWTLLHWYRNPGRGSRHAAMQPAQPDAACGACQVARRSSSSSTSSAPGHEAGARGSLRLLVQAQDEDRRAIGAYLAGGIPRRKPPSIRPRPADEDGSTRWPGGLRGPVRKRPRRRVVGAHPVAGAPDSSADGGGSTGGPPQQLPVCESPGLWRPQRAILNGSAATPSSTDNASTRRDRGQRPGHRDGPSSSGTLAARGSCRVTRREGVIDMVVLEQFIVRLPPANGRSEVGPVPPPDVDDAGHPTGRGPYVALPQGRRAPI